MKHNKIVVIGAGSATFGLTNLGALLRTPELKGSELCLVDINVAGLNQITKLAKRINQEWHSEFTIKNSTDRKEMLPNADFVIISVAIDRDKCWKMDHEIAKKYGIMHYAENAGPGGLMHTARNIALIMPILRDIEALCSDAWVLNFTNPVPRICISAARYTKVKMIGICHQIEFGYMMVAKLLSKELSIDVPEDYKFRWTVESEKEFKRVMKEALGKVDILAAGINHFTWMLSIVEKSTGKDLYPLFRERYKNGFNDFEPLTKEVFDIFDICPVPGDSHMVEYLPYTHNMARNTWDKYDIQMFPFDGSLISRDKMWEDIEAMADGKRPIDHLKDVHTERAELIIAGMTANKHSYEHAVNLPNKGYISNLPDNAIVEIPGVVSAAGIHGVGIGALPESVAELCRRQIAVAELAVEAAVKGDRNKAIQALALDPMIDDPGLAREIFDDYLKEQKKYLPQFLGEKTW